jgi:hypothetical protein
MTVKTSAKIGDQAKYEVKPEKTIKKQYQLPLPWGD